MHSNAALRMWQAAVLIAAALAITLVALSLAYAPRVLVAGSQGFLGYAATAASFHGVSAHRILAFEAESPLPSAGVQAGDLIVDPPRGTFLAGQSTDLQVAHGSVARTVRVAATRIDRLYTPVQTTIDLVLDVFILALGLLIALRRSRDVSALALALGFCLIALALLVPTFPVQRLVGVAYLCGSWLGILSLPAISYFCLSFEGGYRSRFRPWLLRAILVFSVVFAACFFAIAPYYLGRAWISPAPLVNSIPMLLGVGLILCVLTFTDTWRHVEGERRARLRWFFAGAGLGLVNLGVVIAQFIGLFGLSAAAAIRAGIVEDVLFGAGALVLTYSILRRRVVDLGFAISRGLVFAIFTSALLVCFGIVEWFVDHFVKFQQRESSALLDGAIAVALYVSFHRVRRSIERFVERVFFHRWHVREAALRRFLGKAPQFVDRDALTGSLLTAVDAFTGSSGSAIYRRAESGQFVQEKSTRRDLPAAFDPDTDLIVEMKTFRKAVYVSNQVAASGAALGLPMTRRAELEGFLLVGKKIEREGFRPDEVEHLVRATREVGLDLNVLRVEELERRAQELEHRNAALREELQALARAPLDPKTETQGN